MTLWGWKTRAMLDRYNIIDKADLVDGVGLLDRAHAENSATSAQHRGLLIVSPHDSPPYIVGDGDRRKYFSATEGSTLVRDSTRAAAPAVGVRAAHERSEHGRSPRAAQPATP